MKVITVNTVKMNGKYIGPEETIDIADKGILKHLLNAGAVVPLEASRKQKKEVPPVKEDVIKSLMSIKPVDEKTANILYDAKLRSVNDVGEMSVDSLAKIKGISKDLAQKIYDSFE